MADSKQDQYKHNDGVYKQIRGNIGAELDSFPHDIFTEKTENNDNIARDCSKLSKYLKNFHSTQGCKTQNCCQYINHFLNKTVRNDYDSNVSIFEIYIKYMKHNNNNNNDIINLCLPEIKYMDQNEYDKIDSLYRAYETCQFYISNEHDSTSCTYAKPCATAYNNIMTKYKKIDDTKFCKILNDLKDLFEAHKSILIGVCDSRFLASLSYPSECSQLLEKAEKLNEPMYQKIGSLYIPEELQKEVTRAAIVEQSEGPHGIRSTRVEIPGVEVPGVGIVMEASDPLDHTQTDVEDVNAKTPNNNTKIPVGTILYTSLGSVLPLVTLYRFTPLGSWINTKILGRNKLMENMNKNNYALLLNDAGNRESSLNDPMYHITYNSETNH